MVERTGVIAGVSLLAGAALVLIGMNNPEWWKSEMKLAPNSTFMEVSEETVSLLTYTTASTTLTAQRSKPDANFSIQATFAGGRVPQHCLSSPTLAGMLPSFTTIKVKRQIEKKNISSTYPIALGVIEINSAIKNEPPHPQQYFASREHNAIATEQESLAFETDIPYAVFKKLEAGCAELAVR